MDKSFLKTKIFNISKDFGLNLLASLITTGVSQLILYPLLAYYMSADGYGEMLTLMGVANTIAVACGGSLNNTRLLMHDKYDDEEKRGDFAIILWTLSLISVVVLFVIFNNIYNQTFSINIYVIAFSAICLLRSYLSVEYRIILNYKKILLSNVFVALGNFIGILSYVLIKEEMLWPLPFLFGEVCGLIYIVFTTKIIREPIKKSELFSTVVGKEMLLLVSALSSNILTYLDRLLLLPLLGGAAVSTYTVASVFGKSLGILMTPLAGVLLSYYAQRGFSMSRKLFWKINVATVISGVVFCLVSVLISPWFTRLMYPSIYTDASKYLLIANITAIINVVANMTQPSVLKFAPTFWQLIIQAIYCAVYLAGGFYATGLFGLWGFSMAAMLATIIKVLMLYLIGHFFIKV